MECLDGCGQPDNCECDKGLWADNPPEKYERNMDDYRNAPSGIGPKVVGWRDKPHRLIYDLCYEVELLRRKLAENESK